MFGAISQTFGRTFLIAHLVPSGVLCAALLLGMKLGLIDKQWTRGFSAFGVDRGILVMIVIFGVAAAFSLVSKQIMRLYEGYNPRFFFGLALASSAAGAVLGYVRRGEVQPRTPLEYTAFVLALCAALVAGVHRAGTWFHVRRYTRTTTEIAAEQEQAARALRKYHFSRSYPNAPGLILPTRFGNILRAFEHYPSFMFGIEPITIWFRLVAVIPPDYRAAIEQAEASTQFFLNCSTVAVVLSTLATYVAFTRHTLPWAASVPAVLLVAYLLYRLACTTAYDWGEHVRGAFDLYRFDLLRQLAVATPEPTPWSLQVERDIWRRVQRATFYVNPEGRVSYAPAAAKQTGKAPVGFE